jgi:hypothetical protein
MLVGARQVLTCAHVVSDRTDSVPESMVFVDFVSVSGTPWVTARVAEGGWIPVNDDESGDLALLDLDGEASSKVTAPLLRLPMPDRGRPVHAFGFPEGAEQLGIEASAKLAGEGGPGGEWIQLNSESNDTRVTGGFSGAGVVDDTTRGVIGMVVMEYVREQPTVSWMIPVETILRHLPRLAGCVAGPTAVDRELATVAHVSPAQGDVARRYGRWFRRAGPPVRLVVTGEQGSSVSRGLRSMIVLADREQRPRDAGRPGERSVPPIGGVDLAVDAAKKTVKELSARVAERFGSSTDPRRGVPATFVVYGVDAAEDPDALLRDLLKPLADKGMRLLLAFRRETSSAWELARSLWPGGNDPDDHPDVTRTRLADLAALIAAIAEQEDELRRYRAYVAERISDVPDLPQRAFAVRARLSAVRAAPTDTAGLEEAEEAAERAVLRQDKFRRQLDALVERWRELRHRLEAYHAMAVDRGFAEDVHLDQYYRRAQEELWRGPSDLAVAARLVREYRAAIGDGEER